MDRDKSQTYFLTLIRSRVLDRLMFPLEGVSKQEARAMLSERGLPATVRESQDLCFVTSGRYEEFLLNEMRTGAGVGRTDENAHGKEAASGGSPWRWGRLLDREGNVVGTHRGHFAYTIGQRLGYHGRRAYVIEKRPGTNEVVVGDREYALVSRITADEANWFTDPARLLDREVMVKYRYNSPAVAARLSNPGERSFEVTTNEPCFAPAPGQTLACYSNGYLVGGGVIKTTVVKPT